MISYQIVGLPDHVAEEARRTRRSPGYGHPVHQELAMGTGPCRSCLELFEVGAEDRLLLTYQPNCGEHTLGAPGPVFIHAEACQRYEGSRVSEGLAQISLLVEGRTKDGRTLRSTPTHGNEADRVIRECLSRPEIDFVLLRHGEAGCFISRVDRI